MPHRISHPPTFPCLVPRAHIHVVIHVVTYVQYVRRTFVPPLEARAVLAAMGGWVSCAAHVLPRIVDVSVSSHVRFMRLLGRVEVRGISFRARSKERYAS